MRQKRRPNGEFPLRLILEFYDAWLREGELVAAANMMHRDRVCLTQWIQKSPEIRLAKEMAESKRGGMRLDEYVYKHLSKEAKKLWEELEFWEEAKWNGEKVEQILGDKPIRVRQELFVHAMVTRGFNPSEAMRLIGVSQSQVSKWGKDPAFRALLDEIHFHKKNFFEHALVDLVDQKNPFAVMFVNRTINADRGYSEKIKVEHSVDNGFSLDDLELDVDTRRKILEAMRRKKEVQAQEMKALPAPEPIDV